MTDASNVDANVDQKLKEAYFTASQGQLIWARFRKQKAAMVGAWVLIILILSGLLAPFLTPYDPTIAGRDKDYLNGAPQIPKFWDENGFSFRPFVYTVTRERSIATNFRWITTVDRVVDSAAGTFGVMLLLPNTGQELPGGIRCRLSLPGLD